ncbi:Sensor protein FixL [Tautonia plasticadhaerens]|uniref:Sensor protein FixL n=1 Tax=Tautonia plasticadhaerens TaxID=2527974 RepID=A0A518H7N2_9BACT|nr:Sensor protein FixL [Tautonia plasticadhaerens]
MPHPDRPTTLRYGGAALAVLIATIARLVLDPALGDLFPFATLFIAVLVVARYGGRGPALLATALGALASARFLLPPRDRLAVRGFESQAGLLLYLAVGVGIALLGGAMRAARKRAEADAGEADEQRERLRVMLTSIGDAVIAADAQGRVGYLNPVAEALTGRTTSEATGQPLEAAFPILDEETRRAVEIPVRRVLREGVVVGLANHTVLIAADGTERAIEGSAAPVKDAAGRLRGVVLVFRDATERRAAERALRASEARNSAILLTALDAIVTIDHEGKVVDWNPAAEATFGYRRAASLGRELAGLIVPPSLREAHRRGLARYLATGEGTVLDRRIEVTALRADGSEFPAELAITRIPGDGPPLFTAYAGTFRSTRSPNSAAAPGSPSLKSWPRRPRSGRRPPSSCGPSARGSDGIWGRSGGWIGMASGCVASSSGIRHRSGPRSSWKSAGRSPSRRGWACPVGSGAGADPHGSPMSAPTRTSPVRRPPSPGACTGPSASRSGSGPRSSGSSSSSAGRCGSRTTTCWR